MINIKKKKVALIIGGSGQFGLSLGKYLLKKNFEVNITSRNKKKLKEKIKEKILVHNLNIYKLESVDKIIKKINPDYIFYFAGQSSPAKSFYKKKETYLSNAVGCKNFLSIGWGNIALPGFSSKINLICPASFFLSFDMA